MSFLSFLSQEARIGQYCREIESISTFIPATHQINRTGLENLTPDQIWNLQLYFLFTFPQRLSENNYQCLRDFQNYLQVVQQFQGNVFVPGDSPSKIVALIKLLYSDLYQLNEEVRQIKFIEFPLSGLQDAVEENLLDRYLLSIIYDQNVNLTQPNIIYDYVFRGETTRKLMDSLRRIGAADVKVIEMPRASSAGCNSQDYFNLTNSSEQTNSRCVPKYNLNNHLSDLSVNLLRCNAVITMIYLCLTNKLLLGVSPKVKIDPTLLHGRLKLVNIEYYDTQINRFITGWVYVILTLPITNEIVVYQIPEHGPDIKTRTILISTITQYQFHDYQHPLLNLTNGQIISGTLINEFPFIGVYRNNFVDIEYDGYNYHVPVILISKFD